MTILLSDLEAIGVTEAKAKDRTRARVAGTLRANVFWPEKVSATLFSSPASSSGWSDIVSNIERAGSKP